MFNKKLRKAVFIMVIIILMVGMILPFFAKLWR